MKAQKPSISPVRQRMVEDMRIRKLGDRTQEQYLRDVRNFTNYLGRSPDTATVEDLRNYPLHLVDHGTSPASLNSVISGLKFFCNVTLDHPELMTIAVTNSGSSASTQVWPRTTHSVGGWRRCDPVSGWCMPSVHSRVPRRYWPTSPATRIGSPSRTGDWWQ